MIEQRFATELPGVTAPTVNAMLDNGKAEFSTQLVQTVSHPATITIAESMGSPLWDLA